MTEREMCKLASAAILYKEMQKQAFLGDLISMIGSLTGLNQVFPWLQNQIAQRDWDNVNRVVRTPPVARPPLNLRYRYNPHFRSMEPNERFNQTSSS